MRQAQTDVAQTLLFRQFLETFLGLEFVFCNLKPRLERGGFGTTAIRDERGGRGLVDHAGGEFDESGCFAAGAFASEV